MPDNWKIFAARTYALEKIYRPKLLRIIKEYRKDFISDLQTHGQSTAVSNLNNKFYADDLPKTLSDFYKRGALIGIQLQWAALKPFQAEARRMLAAKKELKAASFGRNDVWIREVIRALKLHLLTVLGEITSTMRDDILKILQNGIDQQWSINEIVAKLKDEGLIEARANLIARTELNISSNAGHKIVAQSTPYEVIKGWSAAKDERTRPGHQKVNGEWIDEDGLFKVGIYKGKVLIGYEEMDGPGDPNATISNLANCRCRRLYKPKRDSAGNLIMRDQTQAPVIPMRRVPTYNPAQIAAILKSNVVVTVK